MTCYSNAGTLEIFLRFKINLWLFVPPGYCFSACWVSSTLRRWSENSESVLSSSQLASQTLMSAWSSFLTSQSRGEVCGARCAGRGGGEERGAVTGAVLEALDDGGLAAAVLAEDEGERRVELDVLPVLVARAEGSDTLHL